ncbi:hypothetical protein HRR83_002589 [Exophiala dermatitidis]|uniref:Uncharacterized protein n=2 Tax=Exophiala dermatitidis TaxID=5970 RepID=H6BZN6_EXODN|nr:uncharacterized protein HMPREF1120_05140 [Exophiala dermatitidis NIH/UT8656]KAJ4514503.1 hypothetical protein HRR73_005531 [Exophiala dermatitidis]EHY57090.1 hypothetical protein HMPREF1120_05140 [Exophiala dermatitidis NIH/UT8656]KAJ4537332.1 hypothetical protein HRR76_005343 [Exophiala dermatitidis]KAJ4571280.1 hypothetical protein HRR82_007279 [Exophiala dermatitidis]KAJ4601391.1 hypothetical protein HRR83_002589 [Exophiala dermatitidis]
MTLPTMLLRTATRVSVFVALAFPLRGVSADDFQTDIGTITPTASMSRDFVWTNTSSAPPQATVEIQFDGLVGSGVINLTSNYGFTAVNLTAASTSITPCGSPNPFAANVTSGATIPPLSTHSVSVTNPPSTNATVAPSGNPFTSPSPLSTTDDGSLGSTQSTSFGLPSATVSSANISLFTGVGGRLRVSPATLLMWLLMGLMPTLSVWSDDF